MLGLGGAIFIGSVNPAEGLRHTAARPDHLHGRHEQRAPACRASPSTQTELLGGISLIPMMVGMFAISEVLRHMVDDAATTDRRRSSASARSSRSMWALTKQYPWQWIRGSILGTIIGIQPGSGADMAAWMSYAMSKRFSKEPEKFGTGHPEGLIEAGASNNCVARRRLDSGARLRHSRRFDHRDRHRRADDEEHGRRGRRSS